MLSDAFLFQRSEESLHQAVLTRLLRRDELLGQSIRCDSVGVVFRGEHQAIVAANGLRLASPLDKLLVLPPLITPFLTKNAIVGAVMDGQLG